MSVGAHFSIFYQVRLFNFPLVHSATMLVGLERQGCVGYQSDLTRSVVPSTLYINHCIPRQEHKYLDSHQQTITQEITKTYNPPNPAPA